MYFASLIIYLGGFSDLPAMSISNSDGMVYAPAGQATTVEYHHQLGNILSSPYPLEHDQLA